VDYAEPTPAGGLWLWFQPWLEAFGQHPGALYSDVKPSDAVLFAGHARRWKEETLHYSSVNKIVSHPSYRAIIKMGWKAVPHILLELGTEPDHWFYALGVITKHDPIPSSA
jgi:hypothetical protein